MSTKIRLAIFASGSGSNAEKIIDHFRQQQDIVIAKIWSNRSNAFVHERAKKLDVPSETFAKKDFKEKSFLQELKDVDYIILAGFLWLIPSYLVEAFPSKIINIHPALLPKFGGKGMYGSHVHEAVVRAGEVESGITIHLVNEEYDKGEILFQAKCEVRASDTPDDVAEKIHALEYEHFPKVIEDYIRSHKA
ncbi:MAG: phosphoribosylglycinamide formyltransferase [Ekhidna sp.]|nr:phosphoribosylglycinamide formyltransferase [Ekhidna sp.]